MPTTRRFKFDKSTGISVDAALGKSFSRNVATVNPKAEAVAADESRWDVPMLVPSITPPTNVYLVAASLLYASGVDDDGSTELMVFRDLTNHHLYVFHGGTISFSGSGFTNPSEYNRTTLRPRTISGEENGFDDLFNSGDGFSPVDAVVFHGAIILIGEVFTLGGTGTAYTRVGVGFVVSQDRGITWTRWDPLESTCRHASLSIL